MSSTILLRNGTVLTHGDSDKVIPLYNTDVLITGNTIAEIGSNLSVSDTSNAKVVDCTDKIVSPGFVDTHHHLWQTQMKGRHAEETLLDYMASGNLQSYNYKPSDIFWGQLSGCLEAIDTGTTCVLDHMHGSYTPEHARSGLSATVASGIRSVFAYTIIVRLESWTKDEIIPKDQKELLPEETLDQLEEWCRSHPYPEAKDRVKFGLGFDLFFLPREVVVGIYERYRKAGIHLITSHVQKNALASFNSTTHLLKDYGLLGPDVVFSHGNGLDDEEKKILSNAGVYISSTPETECQMGMGWPLALDPIVKGSLGIDCHTNNTSSIMAQARILLQFGRHEVNLRALEKKEFPTRLRGSSERAFNLATIEGARAVGLEKEIGSIKVGKKADLVIFDTTTPSMCCAGEWDPVTAVVRHSDIRDVECVIIDGVVRKESGKLVDVNVDGKKFGWKGVREELIKSRTEVQKRIDGVSIEKGKDLLLQMWYVDQSKLVDVLEKGE